MPNADEDFIGGSGLTSQISAAHFLKMKNSFRLDVARFLAGLALGKATITYGELSKKFGIATRGWGDILGGIAIRCHEAGYPLLSVVVVNAATRMPSEGAVLYIDLGLTSKAGIVEEQSKCFEFDWSQTALTPVRP
ncbi:hypothetical protein [Mesorhizobium sp. M0030]|uniref:hypothetical protein n=1 Tax=Mesorhizobium sp. M0030 TaxID=2956851 RepID=UPI003335FECF